ncbi:hypothetical protein Droror1_Dr00012100, partial [Drosera rotundifolia]
SRGLHCEAGEIIRSSRRVVSTRESSETAAIYPRPLRPYPSRPSSSPVSLSSQSSQSPEHLQTPETESAPRSKACLFSGNLSSAPITQVSHCDSSLISSSPDIKSSVSAGIDSSSDEHRLN